MKKSEFFKRLDRIPPEYEMIYGFQLNHSLTIGKLVCILTPIGTAGVFIYDIIENTLNTASTEIAVGINYESLDMYYSLLGLAVSNIVLYYFLNKVILRIYRHNEDYIAVKASMIPTFPLKFPFKKGELCESFKTKLFFLRPVNFKLNGQRVFLLPHRFRQPMDLFEMLPKDQAKKYKL